MKRQEAAASLHQPSFLCPRLVVLKRLQMGDERPVERVERCVFVLLVLWLVRLLRRLHCASL